jgi:hypothetical protein
MALFPSFEHRHTRFYPKKTAADGKVEGVYVTGEAPTIDVWRGHLRGDHMLTPIPMRSDGTCWWGAVDIDKKREGSVDHAALARRLADTPLIVSRSKSGDAHVLCFVKEPVPTGLMQAKMRDVAQALGYPRAEVFPKQLTATVDEPGNGLNAPFYGAARDRYSIHVTYGPTGEAMYLDEFLAFAEGKRISQAELRTLSVVGSTRTGSTANDKPASSFADGPPCLQTLAKEGVSSHRNNLVFNLCVYHKQANPDDWADRVYSDAEAMLDLRSDPDFRREMRSTIRSHNKKDYGYKCQEEPICGACDRTTCLSRKHGIGAMREDVAFTTVTATTINETEYGEPKFVIDGFFPVGLSLLGGKPKKGKSSLMRHASVVVATGGRFLGRYYAHKGITLYLALEDNERRLKRDYGRLLKGEKIPEGIIFALQSPALDEGGLDHIREQKRLHPDINLVIVDTLQRVRGQKKARHHLGIYDLDAEALAPLRALAHELEIAIVVVHHFNKRKKDETEDVFDMFSGSTGLTAIPDVLVAMTRQPAENLAFLTAVGRGLDEEIKIAITGDPKTMAWTYRGTAEEARVTDLGDLVLAALRELKAATPTAITRHLGRGDADRGNIGRVLGDLLRRRLIERVAHSRGKYQLVPDQGPLPFDDEVI